MIFSRFSKMVFILPMILFVVFHAGAEEKPEKSTQQKQGLLEIECNVERVALHLCSRDRYVTKEKSVLFGMIKSETHFCSGGEILVGETPVKPVSVLEGKYILLVPSGYHLAHEGPVEIEIEGGKRTYLTLKLFGTRADGRDDYGGAGGGAAGSGSR